MTTTARPTRSTRSTASSRAAADARRLGESLGRLVRALRRASAGPLGSSALSALATVVRSGPIRLGDLAEREGVAPATLSRVVAVLERDGLVDRTIDPDDRRVAHLTATAAGRARFDQVMTVRADLLVERMARLTPQQRATLAAAVDVFERLAED